jgi:hypothetical protein
MDVLQHELRLLRAPRCAEVAASLCCVEDDGGRRAGGGRLTSREMRATWVPMVGFFPD